MAILFPPNNMKYHHTNRFRRNATSVMAGAFDIRPPRDVLTSLLNGVGPYKAVERDEEARQKRKKEKRERERERRRSKAAARALHRAALLADSNQHASTDGNFASTSSLPQPIPTTTPATSSFWRARPTIHIPAIQRWCRLRLRQHPLRILETLPPVRQLILLSHSVHRVLRPRDHVHQPTTRLSALNLAISLHRCPPLHARRGLQ